jgi:hypothetical protein
VKEIVMKRILFATAAFALMSGVAAAQAQDPAQRHDPQEAAKQGAVKAGPSVETTGAIPGPNAEVQPADPEQAAKRRATVNQPTGQGASGGRAPGVQPADPEEAAKRGATINQPSGAGGTSVR